MMINDVDAVETEPYNKRWLDLSEMERSLIWEVMWNVNRVHAHKWIDPDNWEQRSPPEPRAQYCYVSNKKLYHVEVDISGDREVRISVSTFPVCGRLKKMFKSGVGNSVTEYCRRNGMALPFLNFEKWILPGFDFSSRKVPVKARQLDDLRQNLERARALKEEREANMAAKDATDFLWTAVDSVNPMGTLAKYVDDDLFG
jgi:hypothetical protein